MTVLPGDLDLARSVAAAPPRDLAASRVRVPDGERLPVVALVGRPNVGKTTFLVRASGHFAETANLPGTTVGSARREIRAGGRRAVLVDLPGTETLFDRTDGLPPFWQLLLAARPDAILALVDACDVGRHLPLVLACRDLGLPLVVAANLADEADGRGVRLDLGRLSQLLVAPVHRTVGRRGSGVDAAVADAVRLAAARAARPTPRPTSWRAAASPPYAPATVRAVTAAALGIDRDRRAAGLPAGLEAALDEGRLTPIGAATLAAGERLEPERWTVAERWAAEVETADGSEPRLLDRLARLATAPWPGLPLFAAATLACLGLTMLLGTALATLLAAGWSATASPLLATLAATLVPVPALARASLWALDSGLLALLSVGVPFVLSFYVLLAALEDSGYLAVSAVLTDRLLNALGLPGRAAIPVLAATGCNVPAIYGTRVLGTRRERLLAAFLISLTPCSARSAVVVAALAPAAGPAAAMAAFAVIVAVVVVSGLAANAILPGRQSPLVLELPRLRRPVARQVAAKAWFRFRSFVGAAAPVMLAGSFVLGLADEAGAIRPLEAGLAPVVGGLLGLPAVAGIALVLAFLRKELALQLLVVLAVAEYGPAATDLAAFMSPGQLFVYAIVTAVSVPCAATLATLAGEFGWRAAVGLSGAILGVGVGAGALAARLVGVA